MEEDSVNVLNFAECRSQEIMTLMNEVTRQGGKFSLQRLPFHMRRRAASHNPKRLPRNLRVQVSDESLAKHRKKKKAPKNLLEEYNSRQKTDLWLPKKEENCCIICSVSDESLAKHKKKKKAPKNLLEEYNSRQKTDLWLPTHIWFAKRFHMKRMWGYQLPFQATGKRFRSSYRAIVKNALVQDLSYFCCIELSGEEEKIISKLSCLTDESVGMNFASESCIDGTREGHCFVYHPDAFPLHAVGPVSFLWKPCVDKLSVENSCSNCIHRQLWIWCHPSITNELVKILIEIFHLEENLEKSTKEYKFASNVNYMKCKLHFQKEPVYSSDDITMCILKDTLVRHRIIGPNALSIVTSVLKPTKLNDELSKLPEKQLIWTFLSDPKSAYFVPFKTVIGVTVEDPRLHVTSKDVNNFQTDCAQRDEVLNEISKPATAFSKIWDSEFRNEVTAAQVPEAVLNKERGKYVIPKASDLMKHTTSVPVILIHQPATNGYASGWDIIAPQGWGMAFWIPFIYHGAQPAGFDDFCCTNFECRCPTFPLSFPDTEAGCVYEEKVREEKLKKFNRYSRAKRQNFKLLGVPSPFFMPWKLLVNEWEERFLKKYDTTVDERILQNTSDSFFILRSIKDVMYLQNLCQLLQKTCYKEAEIPFRSMIQSILTSQDKLLKALILVKVKCLYRGTPTNCSGVYLPNESDLLNLKNNPKDFGSVETKHDIEELSGMPPKKRRKILKEEAKIESKKSTRPEIKTVISVSERKLIGYISEGGYSRLGSQGYGIGHCAITGFLVLLEQCMKYQMNIIVLIREQHSFQYRPATIEIVDKIF